MRSDYGTMLVICDNEEQEIQFVSKYDGGRLVKEYLNGTLMSAANERKRLVELFDTALKEPNFPFTQRTREKTEALYREYRKMTDEDFFFLTHADDRIDEELMMSYSTKNPDERYHASYCYHERLVNEGEEGPLSTPFTLLNGERAYRARFSEIDWEKIHGSNRSVYEAAYELCVEGREPMNMSERGILERMANRTEYFSNFANKEEYVKYSISYCERSVITADGEYHTHTHDESIVEWAVGFYDRFIAPIKGDPLLAIYEISLI